MNIDCVKVGKLETNCYILTNNQQTLIIDPGDDFKLIDVKVKGNLIGILVTHNHDDHICAIKDFLSKYSVKVYDYNNLEERQYKIGNFDFEVIYTGGHTTDSVTYYFKDNNCLFTGDFLFKDTIGRTDMPTGSFKEMTNSLIKILKYDDNLKVYPGHGSSTTLGYEKRNNYFLINVKQMSSLK